MRPAGVKHTEGVQGEVRRGPPECWGPAHGPGIRQVNEHLAERLRVQEVPSAPEPMVAFRQLVTESPSALYTLDTVDRFPGDPTRPAFIVGRPVEDDSSPPELPSQTGRG